MVVTDQHVYRNAYGRNTGVVPMKTLFKRLYRWSDQNSVLAGSRSYLPMQ